MGRVRDRVAIVTGAAVGLGEATARLLASEGAKVVLTDLKDQDGKSVANAIVEEGGEAIFLHQDVSAEAGWEAVMEAVLDQFGRLDILVNNAGIGTGGPPKEQTLEDWRTAAQSKRRWR